MSTSALRALLEPVAVSIDCPHCLAALHRRVQEVVYEWSAVKVRRPLRLSVDRWLTELTPPRCEEDDLESRHIATPLLGRYPRFPRKVVLRFLLAFVHHKVVTVKIAALSRFPIHHVAINLNMLYTIYPNHTRHLDPRLILQRMSART